MRPNTLPAVPVDYEAIIACPHFKRGYHDVFDQKESAIDRRWSEREIESYQRGRMFGVYVAHVEGQRISLSRGGLVHPNAKMLLIHAMKDRDVL